jgi:hypothetical protein
MALNTVMLSVFVLSVIYADSNKYAHYAECHYADCHYADCHYADCHSAECRYAECHSAFILSLLNWLKVLGLDQGL